MTDDIRPTEFVIGKKTYDRDLERDLFIQRGHLNDDYINHARRFSWYATAVELCEDCEARLKADLAKCFAILDAEVRDEAKDLNVKMTESMVKNTIITRDLYKQIQETYFEAKLNTGLAKAARDAMIHRKDMLIGLGANYRAEGTSDISLKTDQLKK